MCDQGPLCSEGAPLMISGAFAVALSWMHIRISCLINHVIIQVPLPEVHNKMTEIDGLKRQQPFFEHMYILRRIVFDHSQQIAYLSWGCGMTSNHRTVSSVACQLVRSFSQCRYIALR